LQRNTTRLFASYNLKNDTILVNCDKAMSPWFKFWRSIGSAAYNVFNQHRPQTLIERRRKHSLFWI